MRKFLLIIPVIFFLQNITFNSYASWDSGQEISWKCVGTDSFLIKIILYRDCNYAPPGSTIQIEFKCNTTGSTITTTNVSPSNLFDITPVCNSSFSRCSNPSSSFTYGIQRIEYQKLVVLSSAGSCCMIRVSAGDCCRTMDVTTGADQTNIWVEAILNRCLSPCDNSPQFSNDPLVLTRLGQDVYFNNGVFDPDTNKYGAPVDSLVFEWTSPLIGHGTNITYNTPYSYNKPFSFWGFPNESMVAPRGYHLDKNTGDIIFRSVSCDVTPVAIKIREFRNGVYIGEIMRDVTLSIINSSANYNPTIQTPNDQHYFEACAGTPVNLTFQTNDLDTANHVTIKWNNTIKSASWTDNNGQVKLPSATFSWTPDSNHISAQPYMFTVFAEDDHCPMKGTASINIQIKVKATLKASYNIQDNGCGKYNFNAITLNGINPVFNWTGSGNLYISKKNFSFQYTKPGIYPFTLAINTSNACPVIFKDTIVTDNFIYMNLPGDTTVCEGSYLTINPVIYNLKGKCSYQWSTGDTVHKTITVGPVNSDLLISLVVTDSTKCSYSDEIKIHIWKKPLLDIGNDTAICNLSNLTRTLSYVLDTRATSHTLKWYTASDTSAISHAGTITLQKAGQYICFLKDNFNCSSTDTFSLVVHPLPKVFAGKDDSICASPSGYMLNGTPAGTSGYWTGTATYKDTINNKWYFNSGAKEIQHLGAYLLIYHYYDSYQCYNEDTMQIRVSKITVTAGKYGPTCADYSIVPLYGTPGGGLWSGKGIINKDLFSPLIAGSGLHKLIYTYTQWCVKTDTTAIKVYDLPKITVSTQDGRNIFCKEEGAVQLIGKPSGGPFGGSWSGFGLTANNFYTSVGNGVYPLIYHFTDTNSCYNADTLVLTVKDPTVIFLNTENGICIGKTAIISVATTYDHGTYWYKSPGSDGNLTYNLYGNVANYNPGPNDKKNGYFKIYVKTNDSICIPAYAYFSLNIGKYPVADFNAFPTSGFASLQVNFSNKSVLAGSLISSYFWSFGDTYYSSVKNPVHDYLNSGTYNVRLRVTSEYGCEDSVIKFGYINVSPSSVNEKSQQEIIINPNPANNFITIKLKNSSQSINSVMIYNSIGQSVKEFNNLDIKEFRIERDGIEKGIYFLKIGLSGNRIIYYRVLFE